MLVLFNKLDSDYKLREYRRVEESALFYNHLLITQFSGNIRAAFRIGQVSTCYYTTELKWLEKMIQLNRLVKGAGKFVNVTLSKYDKGIREFDGGQVYRMELCRKVLTNVEESELLDYLVLNFDSPEFKNVYYFFAWNFACVFIKGMCKMLLNSDKLSHHDKLRLLKETIC